MLGNLGGMMKQLQEAQKRAERMQEELAAVRLETSTGGGLVTCTGNGLGEIDAIVIDGAKLGLDDDDVELLQDAILAAVRDVAAQAKEHSQAIVEEMTGGLPIPPGMKGLLGG